jgi:hypothetical protein
LGDKIVASKGASKVLAVGTVREPGYEYKSKNGHTVAVDWDTSYEQRIPEERSWFNKTVADIPSLLLKRIFGKPGKTDPAPLCPQDDQGEGREGRQKAQHFQCGGIVPSDPKGEKCHPCQQPVTTS